MIVVVATANAVVANAITCAATNIVAATTAITVVDTIASGKRMESARNTITSLKTISVA